MRKGEATQTRLRTHGLSASSQVWKRNAHLLQWGKNFRLDSCEAPRAACPSSQEHAALCRAFDELFLFS